MATAPGPRRLPSLPGDPDPMLHYKAQFRALDPDLPLALLPVRIETRFSPPAAPPELIVRLFPDTVHADDHEAGLTQLETDLGRSFWDRTWRSGGDPAGEVAAFAWLAAQVGPWRAAWIARELTPTNPGGAPTEPVPDGQPLPKQPKIPDLDIRTTAGTARARLLPLRFIVAGYVEGDLVGTWLGEPIPHDLPLAPGLADATAADGRQLLDSQGLAWLHDVDAAVEVGMAIRIDLTKASDHRALDGFDRLLAFGIRPGDQREGLEALLDAHRYTRGLDLAPQGMPTNRSETAAAALHPDHPDLSLLRQAELGARSTGTRPKLDVEGALYRMAGADAGSVALGLGATNVLDRTSNASLLQGPWAEAMNRALWPAMLGHYLEHLMQGLLDDDAEAWLRSWSTSFVRGGAALPTLLVGTQPYGLLPVCRITATGEPRTNPEQVEEVVGLLRSYWDLSLPGVPLLDPNAADAPDDQASDGDLAGTVSQVLGSVPHPTGFQLRAVDAMRDTYTTAYNGRMFLLGLGATQFPDAHGNPYVDQDDNPAWQRFEKLEADALLDQVWAFTSASVDFRGTTAVGDTVFTTAQSAHYQALGSFIDDYLLDLVTAHAERVAPVAGFVLQESDVSLRMGDDEDPEAFFAYYGEDQSPWAAPLVAGGRGTEDVAGLAKWLAQLAADLADPAAQPYDYSRTFPLLRQCIRKAVEQATDPGDAELVAAGLATLQELVASAADPVGELERLLRETLGTVSHRLDAWYTAVGAWRLENRRAKNPHGLQVGAYGFIVDVRRRATRASQGYVAAPSLAHATTAAVLRAGWSALGGSTETSGLAVNLSSDRIRRARWIVDGVRRGQDLGELLGSRLERRLHDAGLDAWVEPLRQAALDATGTKAAPTAIVDGLLLARARSGATDLDDAETAARAAIDSLLAAKNRPAGDPTTVLGDLVGDLDACADAATAQSVYSLVRGKVPEATATLTAAASGEVTFPALTFSDTPRPALQVTHRLLVMVDPAAEGTWPGSATSGRALAAPGVEAWVAGLLGDAAALAFRVRFDDPGSGATMAGPFSHTLAETSLAALDLLYLVPGGDDTGLGRLGEALTAWGERSRPRDIPVDATLVVETVVGDRSIDDVALAARAIRRLIAHSRDLDGRDLAAPGTTDAASGLDTDELARRVDRVRAALAAGRDRLAATLEPGHPPAGDTRMAMLALSGFELPGRLPSATDQAGLVADANALLTNVDARLAGFDERVAAEDDTWAGLSEVSRYKVLAGRLELLVGQTLPLAPHVTAENGAALDASIARNRLGDATAATRWLNQAGRVDPGARRLRIATDLCDAVFDRSCFAFRLAQLPDHPDETWAAVTRPTADERGRLCLLQTGAGSTFATGRCAGLVVGSWNEAVPRSSQSAGVAVHFDAAGARAPQAVLVCVAPDDSGYDFDLVQDMVEQTLDLARIRMIGPEKLLDLGQFLPGAYLPGALTPGKAP